MLNNTATISLCKYFLIVTGKIIHWRTTMPPRARKRTDCSLWRRRVYRLSAGSVRDLTNQKCLAMFRNKIKGGRRLGFLHTPTPSVLRYTQVCILLLHYYRKQNQNAASRTSASTTPVFVAFINLHKQNFCYFNPLVFYMNIKEVRYVFWTRQRPGWAGGCGGGGLGWKGESDAWGGQEGD